MEYNFHSINKVMIVAEIGNNHEGNIDVALQMIESAAKAGVDAVKFQTFIPEDFVINSDLTRLERLNRFKLSNEEFLLLAKKAKELNVIFFSTPLDLKSALFLNQIQPLFKISSGDNNFYPLIEQVASFNKPTIISTGLADLDHLDRLYKFWSSVGGAYKNLCFMHCVSSYPVPDSQVNLGAIFTLRNKFKNLTIGYSDHTLGIQASILAAATGAKIIEKHFTLNKKYSDFRDHQLSADPEEMANLVIQIKEVSKMLGDGKKQKQNCECEMEELMRRSIAASKDLEAGKTLTPDDIIWVRPGTGIAPGLEKQVIGRKLIHGLKHGDLINNEHLI
ncbi:MAG: hypothetical protein EXR14_06010 [Pelagibacteraceae bacterium]|nr:hypothetical protein [Pelagibacteraceae bacterium]